MASSSATAAAFSFRSLAIFCCRVSGGGMFLSAALLTLGEDPARLRVSRAAVSFPNAEVALTAALELFRQDLGCTDVDGRVATGTLASFTVACTREAPISLVADSDRLRLALRSVTGSLAFDLTGAAAPAYDLTASAELR